MKEKKIIFYFYIYINFDKFSKDNFINSLSLTKFVIFEKREILKFIYFIFDFVKLNMVLLWQLIIFLLLYISSIVKINKFLSLKKENDFFP